MTQHIRGKMEALLADNDTSKYYIEYDGFLFNHVAHGIIALQSLGAEHERMRQFVTWYERRLVRREDHLERPPRAGAEVAGSEVAGLLGTQRGFYTLLRHYQDQLQSKHHSDVTSLLRVEFPQLSEGLAGGCFTA